MDLPKSMRRHRGQVPRHLIGSKAGPDFRLDNKHPFSFFEDARIRQTSSVVVVGEPLRSGDVLLDDPESPCWRKVSDSQPFQEGPKQPPISSQRADKCMCEPVFRLIVLVENVSHAQWSPDGATRTEPTERLLRVATSRVVGRDATSGRSLIDAPAAGRSSPFAWWPHPPGRRGPSRPGPGVV